MQPVPHSWLACALACTPCILDGIGGPLPSYEGCLHPSVVVSVARNSEEVAMIRCNDSVSGVGVCFVKDL